MNNFFQLIRNEQMKLYSQKATWIMFMILALIVIGFGIFTKVDDSILTGGEVPSGDDWKQELQAQNESLETGPKPSEDPQESIKYPAFIDIEMNNYRIENNIKPTKYDVWDFLQTNQNLISIISLFTVIVAAGIVANEFKWGTIKLLLIRPISRTKILFSKYTSVLVLAGTMLVFLYIFSFIVGLALFGMDSLSQPYIFRQNGEIQQAPIFLHTVSQYILSSVNLLMMATFAFMISVVFRNSSLAVGVAIFLMMAGTPLVLFLSTKEYAKYILFANTDLRMYFEGQPILDGQTLGFSLIVLAVYYVIFMFLSWFVFKKRDVAGA